MCSSALGKIHYIQHKNHSFSTDYTKSWAAEKNNAAATSWRGFTLTGILSNRLLQHSCREGGEGSKDFLQISLIQVHLTSSIRKELRIKKLILYFIQI